jgi:hypothetical protein
VDDCIIAGPENQVRKSKEEMMKHIECEEAFYAPVHAPNPIGAQPSQD